MRKILLLLVLIFCSQNILHSQAMKIHQISGRDTSFELTEIDSITFNDYIENDSLLLYDDFESTPLFTFPDYTNWKMFAFESEKRSSVILNSILAENKIKYGGQKAFRINVPLKTEVFLNNKLKRTPDSVYFDLKMYLEKYPDSSEVNSQCSFGFWNIGESLSGENYAGLLIRNNGELYCKIGRKESPVQKIDLNRWYKLRVFFDVKNRSMSLWINLINVVPKYSGTLPSFGYKDFTIYSNSSEVYFDEIKIWQAR